MAAPSVADLARWFTRQIEEEGEPPRREWERPDRGNLSIVPGRAGSATKETGRSGGGGRRRLRGDVRSPGRGRVNGK